MTENPNEEALRQLTERYQQICGTLFHDQGFLPRGIEKIYAQNQCYPYLVISDPPRLNIPPYLNAVLDRFFLGNSFHLTEISMDPEGILFFGHSTSDEIDMEFDINIDTCSLSIVDNNDVASDITNDNELKLMAEVLDVIEQIPSSSFEVHNL